MGEVYKVLHLHLNAIRVIKLMRASIAGEAGADERFIREARLATRINHPNVAALYDFSTLDDGSRYMVWEYIEGTNLHELIETNGPLSPRYAARLAIEALHGLDAIHRAGIVHRDISPENIMICRDEEGEEHVKLIDLGIAKQGDATDGSKTATGMFVGKWKYCSPEHLGMLDAGERIDGRADLYSFGIVLYEMLTGVPPFQADTPHAYLMLHASERPRALAEVNPSMPASPELEALIFRALEKDRKKRFATAREFARALEDLEPSLDDTPGAPPPLPVMSELTEEPTRVSGQAVDPRATTGAEIPSTIQTQAPKPPAQNFANVAISRTPVETASSRVVSPPRRRTAWIVGVLAAVIAAITAGVMVMYKPATPPANSTVTVEQPHVDKAAPIAVAQGHVGINAFPWANVTSIRNLDNGATIELQGTLVTPAPIDLAPGRYEITLSNPAFRQSVTQTVEVRANKESTVTARFQDPTQVALPRFEAQP